MEISSTGTTAEITFVAFIWCRIDDSYDGDYDDDNIDDTYAHDNCDYDSHDADDNDDDKLLPVVGGLRKYTNAYLPKPKYLGWVDPF